MSLYILCLNLFCFDFFSFVFKEAFDKTPMLGDTFAVLLWEKWEITLLTALTALTAILLWKARSQAVPKIRF